MNRNIISVILGALALLSCFLPLAAGGGIYLSVKHMNGYSYLLFLLAPLSIGLALAAIYKPAIAYLKLWTLLVAASGFVIAFVTVAEAVAGVNFLAEKVGTFAYAFSGEDHGPAPIIKARMASGGGFLLFAFGIIFLLGLLPAVKRADRQIIEESPRPVKEQPTDRQS